MATHDAFLHGELSPGWGSPEGARGGASRSPSPDARRAARRSPDARRAPVRAPAGGGRGLPRGFTSPTKVAVAVALGAQMLDGDGGGGGGGGGELPPRAPPGAGDEPAGYHTAPARRDPHRRPSSGRRLFESNS